MSNNHFTKPRLSPEDLAAGCAEAREVVRRKLGHSYAPLGEYRRADGLYPCACREGCPRGVYAWGDIASVCQVGGGPRVDPLVRLRVGQAGRKPRAA